MKIVNRIVMLWGSVFITFNAFGDRGDHIFEGEFYKNNSTLDFFAGAIHTGSHPKGANFSPDGKWLYVANMYSTFTTVINVDKLRNDPALRGDKLFASTGKVKQQLATWLSGFPQIPTANSIMDDIALLDSSSGIVSQIKTPLGHHISKAQSIEVSFSADSRFAFVSQMETEDFDNDGRVSVFDTRTKKLIAEIPTRGGGSKIIGVAKQRDNQGRIVGYVTNWFDWSTSVIDLTPEKLEVLSQKGHTLGTANTELFIKKMKISSLSERRGKNRFGIASRGVAFSNNGDLALITNYDSRSVFVVNARTHQPIAELPPVPKKYGGPSSMRHVVINKDDTLAYISMMDKGAILKVDMEKIRQRFTIHYKGETLRPSEGIWDELLLPWGAGQRNLITSYLSPEHTRPASARGQFTKRINPNTIVLDPNDERYLYVSNRTTILEEGKLDVIDTQLGKIIFSLGAGKHPTALALSPDGCMLVSSEFEKRRLLRFYDVCKLTDTYENTPLGVSVEVN